MTHLDPLPTDGRVPRAQEALERPLSTDGRVPRSTGCASAVQPRTGENSGSEGCARERPLPTVDVVIRCGSGVVLVRRRYPPLGWALPGGFVDSGESLEHAACREALEETGLQITLQEQFFTYSAPHRDPRQHTLSTVYLATAGGEPRGGDDAAEARVWLWDALPERLCFDHGRILGDVRRYLDGGGRVGLEEGGGQL